MKKKRKITKKQMIAMKKQKPLPVFFEKDISSYFVEYPYCSVCGGYVEDDDNYCRHCGQKLDWYSERKKMYLEKPIIMGIYGLE